MIKRGREKVRISRLINDDSDSVNSAKSEGS